MPLNVRDYPWQALERLGREEIRVCRGARRVLQRTFKFGSWARALGELLGADVDGVFHGVELTSAPPSRGVSLYFQADPGGARLAFSSSAELGSVLVSRLLGAPWRLARADAPLDPVAQGALAALVIESARRVGSDSALTSVEAWSAPRLLVAELTLLVDGSPYTVMAWCEPPSTPTREPGRSRTLAELGWVPLSLQLVIGSSQCTRDTLALLRPGDAWIPGETMWLEPGPTHASHSGFGVLCAAGGDCGVKVAFEPDGSLRLVETSMTPLDLDAPSSPPRRGVDDATPTGEHAFLSAAASRIAHASVNNETMSTPSGSPELATEVAMTEDKPLSQVALDAPLVVRVELGSVSMTAREWAALEAGDVIETAQRVTEPVVLRCAGREVARGELVEVEGQVGVRITELVAGAAATSEGKAR